MKKQICTENGFTLVEVLVSVIILGVFLPFAASTLTSNRVWSSYAKHKIEAAWAAQQIIEKERQTSFASLASYSGSVILDTHGNYNNTTCNVNAFCGTGNITVSAESYYNLAGVKTSTSATTDHIVVAISWTEQSYTKPVTMTETYAADIVNSTMLN